VLVAEQPSGGAKKKETRDLQSRGVRGVVVRVAREKVAVAVDDDGGGEEKERGLDGRVWIVRLADDVTYKR
jgi:DNA polymerase alpha-associated DNA helicase A